MSRFVSAGTVEEPPERDEEWLKAQQELDAASRRKQEEANGLQDGGKSLYETLQANKAAKQEQFEESIRLKNQFRSLDEDEVDFLDSVLESTRAKDEAVKKETTEQLDAFRRLQEEAEKAARAEENADVAVEEEEQWHVGNRKRKKGKDKESIKGFKLRKTSSASAAATPALGNTNEAADDAASEKSAQKFSSSPAAVVEKSKKAEGLKKDESDPSQSPSSPTAAGLGLGAYSSDED